MPGTLNKKSVKQDILAKEAKTGQRDVDARRKLNALIAGGTRYCYPHHGYGKNCVKETNKSQRCASTDSNGCCPEECVLE